MEIEKAKTKENIAERIVELSKREQQFEEWEKMRQEAKRRQREDRRLNLFRRKNKTFPVQFGSDEETPEAEETLEFWRNINNKEVSEGWKEDWSIQEVIHEVKRLTGSLTIPRSHNSATYSSDTILPLLFSPFSIFDIQVHFFFQKFPSLNPHPYDYGHGDIHRPKF